MTSGKKSRVPLGMLGFCAILEKFLQKYELFQFKLFASLGDDDIIPSFFA